jgi:hypothetical protein
MMSLGEISRLCFQNEHQSEPSWLGLVGTEVFNEHGHKHQAGRADRGKLNARNTFPLPKDRDHPATSRGALVDLAMLVSEVHCGQRDFPLLPRTMMPASYMEDW